MATLVSGLVPSLRAGGVSRHGLGGRLSAMGRGAGSSSTIRQMSSESKLQWSGATCCPSAGMVHSSRRIAVVSPLSQWPSRRYNATSVPPKPAERTPTATATAKPTVAPTKTAPPEQTSPAPSTSILSRLTALTSLKGAKTTGETGYSSVAKLVELAKPEQKQLAMAVGLVCPLSFLLAPN
jgi:hypothetical protein